jgi:hypothetical protein
MLSCQRPTQVAESLTHQLTAVVPRPRDDATGNDGGQQTYVISVSNTQIPMID